jgi:anti-anti-sigma factor
MSARAISVVRYDGGACVVAFTGGHDLSSAHSLTATLGEVSSAPVLVIDLSRTAFIDSAVLGVLIVSHRETVAAGRRWGLVVGSGSGAAVRRILELTGLGSVMPVYGELSDALASGHPSPSGLST